MSVPLPTFTSEAPLLGGVQMQAKKGETLSLMLPLTVVERWFPPTVSWLAPR